MLFGFTERNRLRQTEAARVKCNPTNVAARVGNISLSDLTVCAQRVGKRVEAAVGQRLLDDATVRVVLVREIGLKLRILDRQHSM